jgi:hypothetical protein
VMRGQKREGFDEPLDAGSADSPSSSPSGGPLSDTLLKPLRTVDDQLTLVVGEQPTVRPRSQPRSCSSFRSGWKVGTSKATAGADRSGFASIRAQRPIVREVEERARRGPAQTVELPMALHRLHPPSCRRTTLKPQP